ncbi:hypothetical protein GYH30_024652 [Glycine max]|nr:hypothetical protein GYH30_024652 [Glycine max]
MEWLQMLPPPSHLYPSVLSFLVTDSTHNAPSPRLPPSPLSSRLNAPSWIAHSMSWLNNSEQVSPHMPPSLVKSTTSLVMLLKG